MDDAVDWAGVPFLPLYIHDGRLLHAPGLFAFVARDPGGARTLLFVDHTDCIARDARMGHPRWREAVELGFNELHVCLRAGARIDRLQLVDRIVRHERPPLGRNGSAASPPVISASAVTLETG